MAGSKTPAPMSLTRSAPASRALEATLAWKVSTLMGWSGSTERTSSMAGQYAVTFGLDADSFGPGSGALAANVEDISAICHHFQGGFSSLLRLAYAASIEKGVRSGVDHPHDAGHLEIKGPALKFKSWGSCASKHGCCKSYKGKVAAETDLRLWENDGRWRHIM